MAKVISYLSSVALLHNSKKIDKQFPTIFCKYKNFHEFGRTDLIRQSVERRKLFMLA